MSYVFVGFLFSFLPFLAPKPRLVNGDESLRNKVNGGPFHLYLKKVADLEAQLFDGLLGDGNLVLGAYAGSRHCRTSYFLTVRI
jgi:hypothetical protein